MYKRTQLDNGLNIITSEMKDMSSVSLGLWIKVGGRYESPAQSGISHLAEHMLFKGTLSRTAKQLKQSIEGVGGAFNGFTADEATCYMVKVPAKHMEAGLDTLSDMALRAKFDSRDLAREKFVIYEEIKMYKDQPAERVLELLAETMWPGDALGRSLAGTLKTVAGIRCSDLKKFRNEYYHPGNISIIATGKARHRDVLSAADRIFESCQKGALSSFAISRAGDIFPRVKFLRGNSKQAHIALGFHYSPENKNMKFAATVMNTILGGNMSSRLFEGLREQKGLCYDISSIYKKHSDTGELHIHAGVDNSCAVKALAAIISELRKISGKLVSEDELKRAKEYLKGQFLLSMEGTMNRMLWIGDRFVIHGRIPALKGILEKIDAVTRRDIRTAANDIFKPEKAAMAVVAKLKTADKDAMRNKFYKL